MNKRNETIELYDIYKKLLTDNQKSYFEDYYFEDLSLSEISENNSVSKAFASKTINLVEDKLNEYEKILRLKGRKKELLELIKNLNDEHLKNKIKEIFD